MKTIGSIVLIVTLLFVAFACPLTALHDGTAQCGFHVIGMHQELINRITQTLLLLVVLVLVLVFLFRIAQNGAVVACYAWTTRADAERPPSREYFHTVTVSRAPPYAA